ncbi:hypothetical protein [Streptomyces aureus]|uniref:Transposase n=1 Tax=Streptomyces aureus TaxID=193461 RepID=A0ABV4SZY1_9ACTN
MADVLLQDLWFHRVEDVVIENVAADGELVAVRARASAQRAVCPGSGAVSARVHSRYVRRLADSAVGGRPVVIELLAVCLNRPLHVVTDAAYHGRALRHLPAAITLTTRLPASAVLFDLAPPPTKKRGRPRLKGSRLGTPAELAVTATFTTTRVARYGRIDQAGIAEVRCLWYGSFHTQTVRVILIRDEDTTTGYDLALVTTDLATPAVALVTRYAWRWSIETTFAEARTLLGVGQAPQPLRERGPPHRPVRPVLLLDHRRLVRVARPTSQRRRRPPRTGPLVHHQDRPVLRRHARQAPPRDHCRPISPRHPRPADRRRNPGRPPSLGPSRPPTHSLIFNHTSPARTAKVEPTIKGPENGTHRVHAKPAKPAHEYRTRIERHSGECHSSIPRNTAYQMSARSGEYSVLMPCHGVRRSTVAT